MGDHALAGPGYFHVGFNYNPSGSKVSKYRASMGFRIVSMVSGRYLTNPIALRTHFIRLLGPKTILYRAVGLFGALVL